MNRRYDNQTGFTLIELLIVMFISTLLLTATISIFVKQEKLMRDETTKTNLRALGRIAMAEMAKELRRAGFGFPGGEGITAMSATAITIQGNIDEVVTTIAEDITSGDDVDVFDDSGFEDGDDIVIADPSPGGFFETLVIDDVGGDNIEATTNFANDYLMEDGVLISQYHTLTYAYDSSNNRITREEDGGGAMPVIGKVASLAFTYRDEDGAVTGVLSDVRRIEIQLTMNDTDGNSTITVVFNTDVNLRNMDG